MSQPAAFKATYADWKLIRTRKCVQIVFEVPLEAADAAYQVVGGMPDPGGSEWFAIARLKPDADREEAPQRERKSWHDMAPAQQAGVLCNEPAFWRYLSDELRRPTTNADEAADVVRNICGVITRRDILPGSAPERRWNGLASHYRVWMRSPEVVG